uniref:Uncharacterized protein n=1 Tax=Lepeophtheirus salmonis TaxID=72036 RepID=A0A0K2UGJ9_LEPSM
MRFDSFPGMIFHPPDV